MGRNLRPSFSQNPTSKLPPPLFRAVAGESGVAFISSSASEFIEMYMGLGAARVRDLFTTVRGRRPSEAHRQVEFIPPTPTLPGCASTQFKS